MFTKDPKDNEGSPGDCFGDCSCVCNKGCTDSCKNSPMKHFCLQTCGCPSNKNATEALLKRSEDYFTQPLDPRSSDELAADFQKRLSKILAKKFNKTDELEDEDEDEEAKYQRKLNSKLVKIERKWNDYVENANKLGVDPTVFCNQTCSHDCFLEANESPYDILTGCLINKCKCFQPKLPKVSSEVSFEALIALKQIIAEEEEAEHQLTQNSVSANSEIIHKEDAPSSEISTEHKKPSLQIALENEESTAEDSSQTESESKENNKKQKQTQESQSEETGEKQNTGENENQESTDSEEETKRIVEEGKKRVEEAGKTAKETAEQEESKVSEIAHKGKEEVNKIVDSVLGQGYDNQTEVPPTSNPPQETPTESETTPAAESGEQVESEKECNLTCFRECLDLKKFVPYPVIQQCIEVRCHCTLDNTSQKLEGLTQLNSIDTFTSSEVQKEKPSVFLNLLLTLFILSILGGAAYFLYQYITEKDRLNKFYEGSEIEETFEETGYQRIL